MCAFLRCNVMTERNINNNEYENNVKLFGKDQRAVNISLISPSGRCVSVSDLIVWPGGTVYSVSTFL